MSEEKRDKDILGKVIDKSVNFIFSKDNRKWILLILLIAFVLRVLVGSRVPFNADEMVHGTHSIGFIESGKLQIMDQDAVWFWLTELSMKIFGYTVFGIRFLSILLGALTVILIYLLGKEIFSEKVGIIAAFIFAISPFQLLETRAEMDISMMFFVLASIYLLTQFYKNNKQKFFYLAWIALGIAIMIKQIAIIFIPAFVLFHLYYNKKIHKKYDLKKIFYAALIILLMILPIITFNYLLFKDKGIVDLQVARFTKIGFDTYKDIAPTIQPFSLTELVLPYNGRMPGFIEGFMFFLRETLLVLLLAIAGIFFLLKQKTKLIWLLILSFLFPFLFLAGTSLLPTHFVFGTSFLALSSGLAIVKFSDWLKDDKNKKRLIYLLLLIILICSIVKIQNSDANGFFGGQNELGKMITYKKQSIDPNSLVIADSRIYRGRTVFMFWDRHYLDATYFLQMIKDTPQLPGEETAINTYYIECVTTDCGWGTIRDQPEFNQSMTDITNFFADSSQLKTTLNDIHNNPYFRVYQKTLSLKPAALDYADSTHAWFYYPVGYKPVMKNFDYYETYNTFDSLLDKFAHLILYLEIFIAILFIFYIFFLLYKTS